MGRMGEKNLMSELHKNITFKPKGKKLRMLENPTFTNHYANKDNHNAPANAHAHTKCFRKHTRVLIV